MNKQDDKATKPRKRRTPEQRDADALAKAEAATAATRARIAKREHKARVINALKAATDYANADDFSECAKLAQHVANVANLCDEAPE